MERPLLRQPLGDLQALDTVDPVKMAGNDPCFVGLDPADEVPGDRQILQFLDLAECLLQVTLTDIPDTCLGNCTDAVGRLTLAHAQECDGVDTSSGVLCRCFNA